MISCETGDVATEQHDAARAAIKRSQECFFHAVSQIARTLIGIKDSLAQPLLHFLLVSALKAKLYFWPRFRSKSQGLSKDFFSNFTLKFCCACLPKNRNQAGLGFSWHWIPTKNNQAIPLYTLTRAHVLLKRQRISFNNILACL